MTNPIVSHEYQPDWITDLCMVLEISKKRAVKVMFVGGQVRWFKPSTFRDHFKHSEECISCDSGDEGVRSPERVTARRLSTIEIQEKP